MLATIKLNTAAKPTKKGYPVVLEIFENHQNRPRKIIAHSFKEFWDEYAAEPRKEHPEYFYLIAIIKDYNAKVAKVNNGNFTFNQAYQLIFSNHITATKEAYLFEFWSTYIAERETKKLPTTNLRNIQNIFFNYLQKKDIPINQITYEWLNWFVVEKLATKKCNIGGVMSYLRTLRSVYKEAQRRESLNIKSNNPFLGIIYDPTPKQPVELTKDDIKKLENFIPKKSTTTENQFKIKRNVAVWLFQFYIGGHDYVDIALLKWTNIKNNRVTFKRHKLRNKKNGGVVINNMLTDKALKIIETYGDTKTERIFSYIPNPVNNTAAYRNYIRNLNRSLERISQTAEIPKITSKSSRYIFRTFAGNKLIHDLLVMKLQGHKPAGITYRYQGQIDTKIQDKNHRKIME